MPPYRQDNLHVKIPGGGGEPVRAEPEVPRAEEEGGDDGQLPGLLRGDAGRGAQEDRGPPDAGMD